MTFETWYSELVSDENMTREQLLNLAENALQDVEGINLQLWNVPDNLEQREYWKEIWIGGYQAAMEKLSDSAFDYQSKWIQRGVEVAELKNQIADANLNYVTAADKIKVLLEALEGLQ